MSRSATAVSLVLILTGLLLLASALGWPIGPIGPTGSGERQGPPVPERSLGRMVDRVRPSVVTLITEDARGERVGLGSGFVVAPGRVVTNHHVIEGASRVVARFDAGREVAVQGILAQDDVADLALLALDPAAPPARSLPLARARPSVGDDVVVIGSPWGLEMTVTTGIVSAWRAHPRQGALLQINAAISPGSSGGPVLNADGFVVGVVRSYREDAQNLNFAVPVAQVRAMGVRGGFPAGVQPFSGSTDEPAAASVPTTQGETAAPPSTPEPEESEAERRIREAETDEWIRISREHFRTRRAEEALVAAAKAVRLSPRNVEALMAVQWALEYLGREKDEIFVLEHVVAIDADHAEAQERLGFIFAHLGSQPETEDEFMRYRLRAWEQYDLLERLRPERAEYVRGAIGWDRSGRAAAPYVPKPLRGSK